MRIDRVSAKPKTTKTINLPCDLIKRFIEFAVELVAIQRCASAARPRLNKEIAHRLQASCMRGARWSQSIYLFAVRQGLSLSGDSEALFCLFTPVPVTWPGNSLKKRSNSRQGGVIVSRRFMCADSVPTQKNSVIL